jgi:ABC-type sugar transport system permease subunit
MYIMTELSTAPAPGSTPALASIKPRRRRFEWFPILMILPAMLVLLLIQVYPIFYTIYLSFQIRRPTGWEFIGLRNLEVLANSSSFHESIGHTVIFLVGYVTLTLVLGFGIALLLNAKTRLSGFYMTLLFIPWVLADIIVGVVFRLMVLPDYGLFSGILQNPAVFPPHGLSILTDTAAAPWIAGFPFPPSPAMVYVILASVWRALPFIILLLLAALQTISHEVIESATIDGAGRWQRIRHIIIPLILPTMVVALFSLILSGVNGVGMVFAMTGGGPGTSTTVISYLLYMLGWVQFDFGGAATLSLLIAIVNIVLILGTLRISRVQRSTD